MKENKRFKVNRDSICLIAYGVVFVVFALAFWIFCPPDGAAVYSMVVLWLLMPLASVLFSYMLAVTEKPRGWKRLAPLMCGAALVLLEYLTFSLKNMIAFPGKINAPSITFFIVGLVASLIGFAFARQDRREMSKGKKGKIVVSAPEAKKEFVEPQPKTEALDSPSKTEVLDTQPESPEIGGASIDTESAPLEDDIEHGEPHDEIDGNLPEENEDSRLDEEKAEEDTEALASIENKDEKVDAELVSQKGEDALAVEDADVTEPSDETAHFEEAEGEEALGNESFDNEDLSAETRDNLHKQG